MRSERSSIGPTHHSVASEYADAELAYCIDCLIVVDAVVVVDAHSDTEPAVKCESFAFERIHRVGLASFGDDSVVECSVVDSADGSFAASDVFAAIDSDAMKSHSD